MPEAGRPLDSSDREARDRRRGSRRSKHRRDFDRLPSLKTIRPQEKAATAGARSSSKQAGRPVIAGGVATGTMGRLRRRPFS